MQFVPDWPTVLFEVARTGLIESQRPGQAWDEVRKNLHPWSTEIVILAGTTTLPASRCGHRFGSLCGGMVPLAKDEARNRAATIQAACRVATRMIDTGRGQDAALQFLVDAVGRALGSPIAVMLGQSGTNGNGLGSDCSFPIFSQDGQPAGELRLGGSAPDGADRAIRTALEGVARTVAAMLAKADRRRD